MASIWIRSLSFSGQYPFLLRKAMIIKKVSIINNWQKVKKLKDASS